MFNRSRLAELGGNTGGTNGKRGRRVSKKKREEIHEAIDERIIRISYNSFSLPSFLRNSYLLCLSASTCLKFSSPCASKYLSTPFLLFRFQFKRDTPMEKDTFSSFVLVTLHSRDASLLEASASHFRI